MSSKFYGGIRCNVLMRYVEELDKESDREGRQGVNGCPFYLFDGKISGFWLLRLQGARKFMRSFWCFGMRSKFCACCVYRLRRDWYFTVECCLVMTAVVRSGFYEWEGQSSSFWRWLRIFGMFIMSWRRHIAKDIQNIRAKGGSHNFRSTNVPGHCLGSTVSSLCFTFSTSIWFYVC